MKQLALILLAAMLCLLCACGEGALEVTGAAVTTLRIMTETPTTETRSKEFIKLASSPEEAFQWIASWDFSLIEDDEYRDHMEYIYSNYNLEWEYILLDCNSDGVDEMYIKLSDNFDSALLCYVDGKVECIYHDEIEGTCFTRPMRDGRLMQTYELWGPGPSYTIMEVDSNNDLVCVDRYSLVAVYYYEAMKDEWDHIPEASPNMTVIYKETECYAFQVPVHKNGESSGTAVQLSKKEWQQARDKINDLLIKDDEFIKFG